MRLRMYNQVVSAVLLNAIALSPISLTLVKQRK